MIELIGYLGTLMFLISGLPFAYRATKHGATEFPYSGIIPIVLGSLLLLIYTAATDPALPLLLNFSVNLTTWLIVLVIKWVDSKWEV